MKPTLFSEKALMEKGRAYMEKVAKEEGLIVTKAVGIDYIAGYKACKEDLREWTKRRECLFKPQASEDFAKGANFGFSLFQRELLAELEEAGR